MCQHARAQEASAPRDFRHHRINAVRRSSGHQPNNELRGMFWLALNWHGLRLDKPVESNKSYLPLPPLGDFSL
jgi:hypothetical protein